MSIMEDACEHTSTGRGRGKKSPLTKVNSWNELHRCIIAEDVERVEELLEGGANPNEPTVSRGNTPLHLACMEGLEDLVETLLQHGADPDSQNVDGESPLHFAVRSGNQSIIEKLLEEDPCLDVVDHENLTPLHWAVLEDDAEMVRTLLRYGADPLVETFTDGNAAFLAVSHDCLSALSVLLSYAPTLLLDVDYEGNSLLHIAVSCGHEAIVECLLAEGIDVSILNDDDATAADLTTSDSILKLIQAYSSPSSSSSSSCSSSSPSSPTASPTMRMPSLPLSSENFHGSLSLPSLSPPLSSRS